MYQDLGLSGVFRDQTRLMGLGEENTEVECPSRHSPLGILAPPPQDVTLRMTLISRPR